MNRIALCSSMMFASGWSSAAWAVCDTGTPKEKMDCLVAEVNVLVSELATTQAELATTRADLDVALGTVALTDDLLLYVSTDPATDSVFFTGANVYVRSGSGATDGPLNGLGNLIVGYGEDAKYYTNLAPPSKRGGSHNLVVGGGNTYTSYGGFVAGSLNLVTERFSSVSGGNSNEANGKNSSVSGGVANLASGFRATVSGGAGNVASGIQTTVSGGVNNTASGGDSSVSGGQLNEAVGARSSVSGGQFNEASGDWSSILGGDSVVEPDDHGTAP